MHEGGARELAIASGMTWRSWLAPGMAGAHVPRRNYFGATKCWATDRSRQFSTTVGNTLRSDPDALPLYRAVASRSKTGHGERSRPQLVVLTHAIVSARSLLSPSPRTVPANQI